MARRRRPPEEPENHERWLVSYADFITLLFAFFVVMYAISSVNEGKYRVLSESLNAVFSERPGSDEPIQIGEPPRDLLALPNGPLAPRQAASQDTEADDAVTETARSERFQKDGTALRASDQITIALQEYLDKDLVRITHSDGRIEIEMQSRMLFGSGDARLSPAALRVLRDLGETLKRIPSHLQVEGHTDNVPIATAVFPSNWELSAARAASVVHFLARTGVEPWRMAAVGLGEHRPIAENADDAGRAKNRRVTIVVLTGQRKHETSVDDEVPWAEGPALELR